MNIYVGNLNYSITEDELSKVFSAYGEVISVKLIIDKMTKRPKGFGFVEMSDDRAATTAIEELNGSDLKGRNMKVNQAKPPAPRESY